MDAHAGQLSLERLRSAYLDHCRARPRPLRSESITKYDKTLLSFMRSLKTQGLPLVLASVTQESVAEWMAEQRRRGLSEDGIASRLGTLKIFTNSYVFKHLELTTRDLLAKVSRYTPPDRPPRVLTQDEIDKILACLDRPTFEDIRNRALVACYIVTGLRLREILELPCSSLDRVTGDIVLIRVKGGGERCAQLSQGAMKHMRAYLRLRPPTKLTDQLWVQADGRPLRLGATHTIMSRLKARSGIARLRWHLFRHGFAQHALIAGADPSLVQEMLGHADGRMTRRYLGRVKQIQAARQMPKFAPRV